MEINYFDLSGGINQATTKTELGNISKKLYWADSKNVEILENKGITKQKGNTVLLELSGNEEIIAMHEMERDNIYKLIIVTVSGKIYVYSDNNETLSLVNKTLSGKNIKFAPFLYGMIIATESDQMFYLKNNASYDTENCNLTDSSDNPVYPDCIAVYKGRVWCAKGGTIYYSALGTYNNFSLQDDAGYINDFHTDTSDIIGMKTYKSYLAIYKKERVYLLTGSNPDDFAIEPFADKGTYSDRSIINVDNKQYFLSNGIYALEQVGELNQIRLGSEISQNIKLEFSKLSNARIGETIALHYQNKHQMWYFFPYINEQYFKTIWINDYINYAWYKRVLPQNITCACNFKNYILTADDSGIVYIEDSGKDFNGQTIDFMWKSPFLSLGDVHHRKIIDEFYFVLDNGIDNKFNFSVYKDYDDNYTEDKEVIYADHFDQLIWAVDNTANPMSYWPEDQESSPVWSISTNVIEKAEICDNLYSVQLCIDGNSEDYNCGIIGLQFREIYKED